MSGYNQDRLGFILLLLATLVQRVNFELLPGQQVVPDPKVTIRPKYGIQMVVRRRNLAH